MATLESLFPRLEALAIDAPVVVAHRGDSRNHPENTLAAFRAAAEIGCPMQEFDVRCTRDGVLVCIHDAGLDRTTDAAVRLGPGALVAEMTLEALQHLDAGAWHPGGSGTARVPTLVAALDAMLPTSIPLIEHKAGEPETFVAALRRAGRLEQCILQSFDWPFVAAAKRLAPELAVAILGPIGTSGRLDEATVTAATGCGAGMVHWHDRSLESDGIALAHAAGLLVCSYTTDDELGLRGGAALGIDAMCTNDPAHMMGLRRAGLLRRQGAGRAPADS